MKFTLSICLFMISAGVCGALPFQRRHSPIDDIVKRNVNGNPLMRRGLPGIDEAGLGGATDSLKSIFSGVLKRENLFGPQAESLPPTKDGIHLSTPKRAVFERQVPDPTALLAEVEGVAGGVGGGVSGVGGSGSSLPI